MAQSSLLAHTTHTRTRGAPCGKPGPSPEGTARARKTPTTLHTPYKGRAGGRSEHDVPLSLALSRRLTSTSATPEPPVRDPPRTIPPGPPPVTTSQRFGRQVGSNVGGPSWRKAPSWHTRHTRAHAELHAESPVRRPRAQPEPARHPPTTLHTPYRAGRAGAQSRCSPLARSLARSHSTSATPEPMSEILRGSFPPGPPPVTTSQRLGRQVGRM